MKEQLIDNLIACEWDMFGQVTNAGSRASCQDDFDTFRIMRGSQFATWPEDALHSYLEDLQTAQAEGRNLLTEKYARMMASTHPFEYQQIQAQLHVIDDETEKMIEEIVAVNVSWQRDVDQKYYELRRKGRPLTSEADNWHTTSFETYLRGELQTYSSKTIAMYHAYTVQCQKEGRNLAEENLAHIARAYGKTL